MVSPLARRKVWSPFGGWWPEGITKFWWKIWAQGWINEWRCPCDIIICVKREHPPLPHRWLNIYVSGKGVTTSEEESLFYRGKWNWSRTCAHLFNKHLLQRVLSPDKIFYTVRHWIISRVVAGSAVIVTYILYYVGKEAKCKRNIEPSGIERGERGSPLEP